MHYIQTEIIKRVSLNPASSFAELQDKTITSNLFAYHLKKLVQDKLVEKEHERYALSIAGKEYANRLEIEKTVPIITYQPKVAVKVYAFYGDSIHSDFVARVRLKEPFYKYTGVISTRVRFGEEFGEAVDLEMKSRVGLSYSELNYHGYIRIINKLDGSVVEDKIFYLFTVFNCKGDLIENTEDLRQYRVSHKDFWRTENVYTGQQEGWKIIEGKLEPNQTFKFDLDHF